LKCVNLFAGPSDNTCGTRILIDRWSWVWVVSFYY
jgi:hypothetical protein